MKCVKFSYDLSMSAITFDILVFLSQCEEERIKNDAEGIIINFVGGRRKMSWRDQEITNDQHAWRLRYLLPEIAKLLPSVVQVNLVGEGDPQIFPYVLFPARYAPILHSPSYAASLIPDFGDYITMTVRQSWFHAMRDTNIEIWREVLNTLTTAGRKIIVVPDTEATMQGQLCYVYSPRLYTPAAFSLPLRMALYEKAKLNLFTSGGPMMLGAYSNINAESFNLVVNGVSVCTPGHLTKVGLPDGCRAQNSVYHWSGEKDFVLTTIQKRLVELDRSSNGTSKQTRVS